MLLRALSLGLSLAVVSVAQGGAVVTLVPATPGPYAPDSTVSVEVRLSQLGTTGDKLLRMVQLDLRATDANLTLELPETYNLDGFNVTGPDDIRFWSFDSVEACQVNPDSCAAHHFVVDELTTVVPPAQKIISATFGSETQLGESAVFQYTLPGDGSPLVLGTMNVTMPSAEGDYALDVLNSAETDVDRGGQVRFGFGCPGGVPPCSDPITVWRATGADLTGGSTVMQVRDVSCAPENVVKWESVGFHGRNFNADWAMEITPKNGASNLPTFVEPRLSGLSQIRVTFDQNVAAASAIPGNIQVAGVDENNAAVDTSASVIGVALSAGAGGATSVMEISFTPALPNYANYTIAFAGVTAECSGTAFSGDVSRCMSALIGDVNGNLRVQTNDVGGARSFVGIDPIDPVTQPFHARADVNNDGRIRTNDVGGVRAFVGNDIRPGICPAIP